MTLCQKASGHPRGGRESGRGFGRKVELGVISITVKVNVEFAKDIAKEEEVNDEEYGAARQSPGAHLK